MLLIYKTDLKIYTLQIQNDCDYRHQIRNIGIKSIFKNEI